MPFYKMTRPSYQSDHESNRQNPIQTTKGNTVSLPGIVCPRCGFWTSSVRLRVDDAISQKVSEYVSDQNIPDQLTYAEWKEFVPAFSNRTGLKMEDLRPGAKIGLPSGEVLHNSENEIFHVFPGQIWVTERVVHAVRGANLRAIDFTKVNLSLLSGQIPQSSQILNLWEIVVSGKAMRVGSSVETVTVCQECLRTVFPNPSILTVDETRWDGSDFFHVDFNPHVLIVTDKVFDLFNSHAFSNCRFIPIE